MSHEKTKEEPFCQGCDCCDEASEVIDNLMAHVADLVKRMDKSNRIARELPEFGAHVWIDEGTLMICESNTFADCGGTVAGVYANEMHGEVTAPESQIFLDSVNKEFGTTFAIDEFSGR